MCENLLKTILTHNTELEVVLKWLRNEIVPQFEYDCIQAEFILYVLNYIHDELISVFKTVPNHQIPVQIQTTPRKRITTDEIIIRNRTSTPNKSTERLHFNENNLSPIAPNRNENRTKPNATLCLGDFFQTTNKQSKPKRKSIDLNQTERIVHRRINPTKIQDSGTRTERCNNLFQTEIPIERDKLREEMKLIAKTKQMAEPYRNNNNRLEVENLSRIESNLNKVTFRSQLDVLVKLYSFLIEANYVLNPFSELYNLIALVLIRFDNRNDFQTNSLFSSVHNCVYFASNVLINFGPILSQLDRTSLKMLQDNKRLKHFAPFLIEQLTKWYNEKRKTERNDDSLLMFRNEPVDNISFVSDTDNRENFTTDVSFHSFRKQRDLFYELLRIWDLNHMQHNWNFGMNLAGKIRQLFTVYVDSVNFMHLARLIKNQLLADSNTNQNDTIPIPNDLLQQNIDAGKLFRLKNRLISNRNPTGPEPTFPGRQEFYKELLLINNSALFYKHFVDCLSAEILELNETEIWLSDVDETVALARNTYVHCLHSLRILGKFLGFLDALPYQSDQIPAATILESQIRIRKEFTPSVDVFDCVQTAIQSGKLTLTIPWVTEYLAMFDFTTLRLPYFNRLIGTLFHLHVNCKETQIRLCLGWLFERPQFPLDSYQNWIGRNYFQDVLTNSSSRSDPKPNSTGVDHLHLVDESVLYLCCPYLLEIRNVLISDPESNFNSATVKCIRPTTSDSFATTTTGAHVKLQVQLEEAFFNGQPSSVRRTVDLVSERIASASVKYICNKLVPDAKSEAMNTFQSHLLHIIQESEEEIQSELNKCCQKYANELAVECFNQFTIKLNEELKEMYQKRSENSLNALLPDDFHPTALDTCISVTIRLCTERVKQWYIAHVNSDIFLKELKLEMERKLKRTSGKKLTYTLPTKGRNDIEHDANVSSPVVVLVTLQDLLYKALEKPETIRVETLIETVNDAIKTCQQRCDINSIAQHFICKIFLDLTLLLATNRPELLSSDSLVLPNLFTFWTKCAPNESELFERIFCPRNVSVFSRSKRPLETWNTCAQLIVLALECGALKAEQFERQTITMFRYDWQPNIVRYFVRCLQTVVDLYFVKNGRNDQIRFILSWIADFCSHEDDNGD